MFNSRALVVLFTLGLLQACGDSETSSTVSDDSANSAKLTEQSSGNLAPAQAQLTVTDIAPATTNATGSTYQDLQGNPLELSAYAGKKVFLNYWATWCAPCIREIPSISRAAAILENENYVFLLASDEPLETITEFLQEREFTGNFIKLNGFFGGHGIDAVPSSVLFDENGAMVKTWPGAFEWDSPEMLGELRNVQ